MRIDTDLAIRIVHSAVLAPHRQIGTLKSDDYAKWLHNRGLGVSIFDWQTLHHLWSIGAT